MRQVKQEKIGFQMPLPLSFSIMLILVVQNRSFFVSSANKQAY